MSKKHFTIFFLSLALSHSAFAAEVLIWGGSSTNRNAVADHLNNNGHPVTNNGNSIPTAGQLSGIDVAIVLRDDGNNDVINWVQAGGCLITEWIGADWALNDANLLDATVSGGGAVGTDTPVTVTADGIAAGLASGIPNPYSAGPASQFFRNFSGIGGSVSVMATRPGDNPAILGGQSGSGLVLANGIDWADNEFFGADNRQFLLNSIEGFCGGARFVPQPVPSLSMYGLLLLVGMMGILAVFSHRRRQSNI